jgi:uncharacterized protein
MDCRYCYYLNKQQLYPEVRSPRMSDDVLEQYIVQHIEACPNPVINFSWHGGEPTILGLDYFRNVAALQRRHKPPGKRIINGLQTNGILLDEQWCRFMFEESFGVGLSLDGPREMHDRYRVSRGHEPTHQQTMGAFELLKRHNVPCDILCVVSDCNATHPLEIYRFFREIGATYVGFLPAVQPMPGAPGGVSPHTVPAEAYGSFLCAIFDEWIRRDVGRVMVQIFDEASRPLRRMDHSLCIYRPTCGDIPVVEYNGDFYACDHFVDEMHRIGNVRDTALVELLESPAQRAFGDAKRDSLPAYCLQCEVLAMCNGGCPKDRFLRTPDGEPGLNYLCAGLKKFFIHSRPGLSGLAGPSAPTLRPRKPAGAADRNAPCPCGSGRKYKKCCGR